MDVITQYYHVAKEVYADNLSPKPAFRIIIITRIIIYNILFLHWGKLNYKTRHGLAPCCDASCELCLFQDPDCDDYTLPGPMEGSFGNYKSDKKALGK